MSAAVKTGRMKVDENIEKEKKNRIPEKKYTTQTLPSRLWTRWA